MALYSNLEIDLLSRTNYTGDQKIVALSVLFHLHTNSPD